jgi:ADP-dependent NAD(P)H-hydrate dehydratase / NAD(P)H-hydrate epimerase
MELVLSVEQMQRMDRLASEELGLPSVCLMENAGRGCAEAVLEEVDRRGARRVAILCGGGNNGGDGFVIARNLANQGLDPEIYALVPAARTTGDAAIMRGVVEKMGLPVVELDGEEAIPDFRGMDLVVDALLGTGLKGAPTGLTAQLISAVADSAVPVIAIDIPSGIQGDSGKVEGAAIQAELTLTMAAAKRGLLLAPGRDYCGEIRVVDIGYAPGDLVEGAEWGRADEHDLRGLLPLRGPSSHKGDHGKVLLLAGSLGMAGAALLASRAALRSGAGMARLAAPEAVVAQLAGAMPEVMTLPLAGDRKDLERLLAALDWADILAVGPGLGTEPGTRKLVRELLRRCGKPTVLDADGLAAFDGEPKALGEREAPLCITPHGGEFLRLLGKQGEFSQHAMLLRAGELATELELTLVLKGAPTVIHTAGGDVLISGTGNHGMATAGVGDVLTGLIAGLAAQGLELDDAALLGVHLHGLAGDLAAQRFGPRGMTAVEVLGFLPAAFRALEDPPHAESGHEGHGH